MRKVYLIIHFTKTCTGHGEFDYVMDKIVGDGFFATKEAAEKCLSNMPWKEEHVIKEITQL